MEETNLSDSLNFVLKRSVEKSPNNVSIETFNVYTEVFVRCHHKVRKLAGGCKLPN